MAFSAFQLGVGGRTTAVAVVFVAVEACKAFVEETEPEI